ncbi:MAG: CAP domain-containing protein [Thermoanaerobaculia bacterium]
MKLTRVLSPLALLLPVCCAGLPHSESPVRRVVAPNLEHPLSERYPSSSVPKDPVKTAVLAQINRDRERAGLPAVAWDEEAGRVADAFCARQVREKTRGHYLMDGIPPYARTSFAGVFGMQLENAASWRTTGTSFTQDARELALSSHAGMMAEVPPKDGHRKTILDPDVTHVGVGWNSEGGRFQMAEEFLARRLAWLSLARAPGDRVILRFEGQTLSDRIQLVTIAWEPGPAPLTQKEASARSSYLYPQPRQSLIPEGHRASVSGTVAQDRIRLAKGGEFSFEFAPDRTGLWTLVFYTARTLAGRGRPAGSVTFWVE